MPLRVGTAPVGVARTSHGVGRSRSRPGSMPPSTGIDATLSQADPTKCGVVPTPTGIDAPNHQDDAGQTRERPIRAESMPLNARSIPHIPRSIPLRGTWMPCGLRSFPDEAGTDSNPSESPPDAKTLRHPIKLDIEADCRSPQCRFAVFPPILV